MIVRRDSREQASLKDAPHLPVLAKLPVGKTGMLVSDGRTGRSCAIFQAATSDLELPLAHVEHDGYNTTTQWHDHVFLIEVT